MLKGYFNISVMNERLKQAIVLNKKLRAQLLHKNTTVFLTTIHKEQFSDTVAELVDKRDKILADLGALKKVGGLSLEKRLSEKDEVFHDVESKLSYHCAVNTTSFCKFMRPPFTWTFLNLKDLCKLLLSLYNILLSV
jgi:hypothetical protein